MSGLDWFFTSLLAVLYITLVFTVAMLTFQKGHYLLGWVGIIFPFLWLIGAVLPPRPGSSYAARQRLA
jgi:hypothetical protein